MDKPFSQACENNKLPILDKLKSHFSRLPWVFEVGSGTGQHGVYFSAQMPSLGWQLADRPCNHAGLELWRESVQQSNLWAPLTLDLNDPWPMSELPAIYTANTLHIVSKPLVIRFFEGIKLHLVSQGKVFIYGPFNYGGEFTSESNAAFDAFLKSNDNQSGIRDIEWIIELAEYAGLSLLEDHAMPANNRLLILQKAL